MEQAIKEIRNQKEVVEQSLKEVEEQKQDNSSIYQLAKQEFLLAAGNPKAILFYMGILKL